jgi:hypothetical protein
MKIPLLTLRTSHSYRHKDRNFIDVDYDGKPLTFRYTDVRGSGILEGSNGKSNYIKFTIPYTRDNVKTLEKYKRCYVCICTFHYLEVFEKGESSLDDLIKSGCIIDDPFRIYSKDSIVPNEEFSIYIKIFDRTRIKGAINDNPGKLNFYIESMRLDKILEKAEKTAIKYDVDLASKLFSELKIK